MDDTSFDLPKDLNKIIELMEAIPEDWASLRGNLKAGNELIRAGLISQKDSLVFKTRDYEPKLQGESYKEVIWKNKKADLHALFCKRRLPEFINFEDAGYGNSPRTISELKELIFEWLKIGYSGRLQFIADFVDDCANNYTATATFFLEGRRETDIKANRVKSSYYCASINISGDNKILWPLLSIIKLFDLPSNTHTLDIIEPMESLIPGLKEFRKERGLDKREKTD